MMQCCECAYYDLLKAACRNKRSDKSKRSRPYLDAPVVFPFESACEFGVKVSYSYSTSTTIDESNVTHVNGRSWS